jgi:hypothetical protein
VRRSAGKAGYLARAKRSSGPHHRPRCDQLGVAEFGNATDGQRDPKLSRPGRAGDRRGAAEPGCADCSVSGCAGSADS